MTHVFKQLTFFLLLVVGLTIEIQANTTLPPSKTEYTKTIKKNYNMSADGDVTLSNKYGQINLKTWNRNEVSIDVTIVVKARNESVANDIFDRVGVDFSNGSSYVKAETIIESQKSNWWGSGDKGDFRIDYVVNIPSKASLELSNKYGDSKIDAIGGDANINVKYGNFNLESVGKSTEITLGYGKGVIGQLNKAAINVKYSKIKLKEVGDLNLESKYSKIYIDKADKIKSVSKYDTYDLGELDELSNQGKYDHFEVEKVDRISVYAKYTDYEIDELSQNGDFETKYGGITIEKLNRGFDLLNFECEYTDCKVYLDDNVGFQLDASANYASIQYPNDMEVNYEKNKNASHEVKGQRGGANGGKIKARLSYGGLKVK